VSALPWDQRAVRDGRALTAVQGSIRGAPLPGWRSDGETLRTFATFTTKANPTLALIRHHRAGRLAALARRSGRWRGGAAASPPRLPSCASGRSRGRSTTSGTTGRNCSCRAASQSGNHRLRRTCPKCP